MHRLTPQEVAALDAAPVGERYFYTLSVLLDEQWVWALAVDGDWLWLPYDARRRMLPIWPHAEQAMGCARPGMEAHPIALADWETKWIPRLESADELILVYPGPQIEGTITTAEGVRADLDGERALRTDPEAAQAYMSAVYEMLTVDEDEDVPAPTAFVPQAQLGPGAVTGPGVASPPRSGTTSAPRQAPPSPSDEPDDGPPVLF